MLESVLIHLIFKEGMTSWQGQIRHGSLITFIDMALQNRFQGDKPLPSAMLSLLKMGDCRILNDFLTTWGASTLTG